jgi:hypothetical protein
MVRTRALVSVPLAVVLFVALTTPARADGPSLWPWAKRPDRSIRPIDPAP